MDKTRQYGATIDQIRADHVQRYLFAASGLEKGAKVLDLACGCGYGSWLLHGAGASVTGIDICEDAINYARKHYQGPQYKQQKAEETEGQWDVLVSFETLEHLDNPSIVLGHVRASQIICSVPNEERMPFVAGHFKHDEYPHKRHYTPKEFENMLREAGYLVKEKYCQKDKQGKISEGTDGMFLIYVGTR